MRENKFFRVLKIGEETVYASFYFIDGTVTELGFFPLDTKVKNWVCYKDKKTSEVIRAIKEQARLGFPNSPTPKPVDPLWV